MSYLDDSLAYDRYLDSLSDPCECGDCDSVFTPADGPCPRCEWEADHCRECGEEMPMSRHDRCQACRCVAIVRMAA